MPLGVLCGEAGAASSKADGKNKLKLLEKNAGKLKLQWLSTRSAAESLLGLIAANEDYAWARSPAIQGKVKGCCDQLDADKSMFARSFLFEKDMRKAKDAYGATWEVELTKFMQYGGKLSELQGLLETISSMHAKR